MNKRKILALALTVAMIAILAVGGTLAYFTAEDSATNTFTVGNVSISLTEPNWDKTGAAEAQDAYPGEALAKDPTVTNDGKNPCFVRISVTNLDQFGENSPIIYRTDWTDNKLGTGWTLHTDGYFYYTKVLAAGETTDALFDQIVMPKTITNNATTEDIVVTAQAVQAQGANDLNWAGVQTMSVADIAIWFGTCGMNK